MAVKTNKFLQENVMPVSVMLFCGVIRVPNRLIHTYSSHVWACSE